MKKYLLILSLLIFLFSCSKTNENIKESITLPTLTKLRVILNPDSIFLLNDSLESHLTDFTIIGTFSDGTLKEITPTKEIFMKFDTSSPGENTLTIKIDNISASIKYTVYESFVTSLKVNLKDGTKIYKDMPISYLLPNITLEASFLDGSKKNISVSESMISNFNSSIQGRNDITITLSNKSITFPIEIFPKHIYFKALGDKDFNITGIHITDIGTGKTLYLYNYSTDEILLPPGNFTFLIFWKDASNNDRSSTYNVSLNSYEFLDYNSVVIFTFSETGYWGGNYSK